jgi:hypothetical protein
MSEINQNHIERNTIITVFVIKGYAGCFKSEAVSSFAPIAPLP